DESLPDHLRCKRTDGRQWRCNRRVMENKKLCEIHHLQGRHRQYKQKVPESLKIQRKDRNNNNNKGETRAKLGKPMKRRGRAIGKSEALDEAVKKMKLKRGDLQLELIRMVLKREIEKKNKKERDFEDSNDFEDGELMRDLPNGLMAISSSPHSKDNQNNNNASGSCDSPNIDGLDFKSVKRRCFRSKNIEPVPVAAVEGLGCKDNVVSLRRGKRKRCHWCRRSGIRRLVKCSSCRKDFFCLDCIRERYFESQEEVKMACPVCRKTCGCKACSANQSSEFDCKDFLREKNKVDKVLRLHYLICMLLPFLKQINQVQGIELELEAKIRGSQEPSAVRIQQAESSCSKKHCCNNCKTSILNFHRSCPSCSYNLCLSCCWNIFQDSLSESIKALTCKYLNGRKTTLSGIQFPEKKFVSTFSKCYTSTYFDSCASLPSWRAPDCSVGISCPPTEFGGCGDGLLDLRCVFPLSWTKEMEINAEEIVGSYELPETVDIFSCCSLCLGMDHEADGIKHLQEAARRENSNDNFLYFPTIPDIRVDNFEHFQKHWGKGQPVIVQNVLQGESDLSWDPVAMFCTYLKNAGGKSEYDEEVLGATKGLDWFEVEIGIRQLFLGSFRGRTDANICDEKLKLKGWLSSHLFQKQFPAHYAEVIHTLPLPEYMDPKYGILNIAAKLPPEVPRPDLGPCVHISYGSGEEFVQADSVRNLCYKMCDLVNILAHTTEIPVSTKQLNVLRKLMKKAQDQRESTKILLDQQKMAYESKGKLPSYDENMEEVGLHNIDKEGLHACRSGTHEATNLSLKDKDLSPNREHDSDTDSENSIIQCRTIEVLKTSENQKDSADNTESSSYSRKENFTKPCGAQWDVFRRQDVPKLIDYLKRHCNEFPHPNGCLKHVVHPILDQSFFLDKTHIMRLKEEFNIEPWSFEQHVGEAVIIPTGCPYQIKNLKSCVNVVLDFVSPENVTESIQLMNEVCLLPEDYEAKVDKLEVNKMALHGISAAIKEIRNLTCADS
ncbi:JmjC domain-containing protein/WRC domain-containing protein, partial [Cephalotus follicularis]